MNLPRPEYLQALIALEDEAPDVLCEALTGSTVPLWPLVRSNVALAMSEVELASVVISSGSSQFQALSRAARALGPSRRDVRRLRHRSPVLFMTSGATLYELGGQIRNWLVGDFADATSDNVPVIQWLPIEARRPRFAHTSTWTLDPVVARAEVKGRLSRSAPRDPKEATRVIREIAAKLGGGLRDQQIEDIAASATYAIRIEQHVLAELNRLFDRTMPELVLVDSPVDGGRGAVLAAIKRRGIHVAELQHGWIGPGHAAYNFGSIMSQDELAATIPDELLTFGEWWGRGLQWPGVITPIGKPHFEHARRSTLDLDERPREVLVVSSVGNPRETSIFCARLRETLPDDWLVRFRPHPSERSVIDDRYPDLTCADGIVIDRSDDVYLALAQARAVIGVASTVLFEAAGMGCMVYVRDTPYAKYIVGDTFGPVLSTTEDLIRAVSEITESKAVQSPSAEDVAGFWRSDAIANFVRWRTEGRPVTKLC